MRYLVPVLTGVVDPSHRTWLEDINKSTKKETQNSKNLTKAITNNATELSAIQVHVQASSPFTHSHNRTPSLRLSMKLSPIFLPVTSWIHSLSSSSFWGSYFPASWGRGGTEVGGQTQDWNFCFICSFVTKWQLISAHEILHDQAHSLVAGLKSF